MYSYAHTYPNMHTHICLSETVITNYYCHLFSELPVSNSELHDVLPEVLVANRRIME